QNHQAKVDYLLGYYLLVLHIYLMFPYYFSSALINFSKLVFSFIHLSVNFFTSLILSIFLKKSTILGINAFSTLLTGRLSKVIITSGYRDGLVAPHSINDLNNGFSILVD